MTPNSHGILPIQELRKAVAEGIISSPANSPIPHKNLQPPAWICGWATWAHRLRCGFLPQNGNVLDWPGGPGNGVHSPRTGRGIGGQPTVPGSPAGGVGPAAGRPSPDQPQEFHREAGPVHPGHHRPVQPVRQHGPRVPGPDVPGNRLPLLRLPGRDGSLPEPDPATPRRPQAIGGRSPGAAFTEPPGPAGREALPVPPRRPGRGAAPGSGPSRGRKRTVGTGPAGTAGCWI